MKNVFTSGWLYAIVAIMGLLIFLPGWSSDEPQTKPVAGLSVPYSGTTNSSGVYTLTFPNAYTVAPNVQVTYSNQTGTNQYFRVQSVTTSAVTIYAYSRGILNISLVGDVLAGAVTNTSGANFDVLVTAKE